MDWREHGEELVDVPEEVRARIARLVQEKSPWLAEVYLSVTKGTLARVLQGRRVKRWQAQRMFARLGGIDWPKD